MVRSMSSETKELGPLARLAGIWEGDEGHDEAPSDSRDTEQNLYRERMEFVPTGRVDNHEQILFGLRYRTTAWRLSADEPFHEELGYWMWDAARKQAMRCFLVPRGIAVIAGGTVEPDADSFSLAAVLGSPTYGICAQPFLDEQFKTVRYELTVTFHPDGSFSYDEDTQMQLPDRVRLFHHTDRNTLRLVES
jgi:hypothetical protein